MPEKSKQIQKFVEALFKEPELQQKMLDALYSGQKVARRALVNFNPPKFELCPPEFWQSPNVGIPSGEINPGKDPAHQDGEYYCLDASSAFFISGLSFLNQKIKTIIDVCAAPGGKSILSWANFAPELLISNEPINSRIPALISNLKRCKISPCLLTCMDPAALAQAATGTADLVLVDAPCSGQSMFPLGKQYASAFHKNVINKNAMRQRRILSEALKLVAPGGLLAYTTCTFATEENEKNLQWLVEHNQEFSVQEISEYRDFKSSFSSLPCYRIFPWQNLGTGGFLAVLKRHGSEDPQPLEKSALKVAWQQDLGSL